MKSVFQRQFAPRPPRSHAASLPAGATLGAGRSDLSLAHPITRLPDHPMGGMHG